MGEIDNHHRVMALSTSTEAFDDGTATSTEELSSSAMHKEPNTPSTSSHTTSGDSAEDFNPSDVSQPEESSPIESLNTAGSLLETTTSCQDENVMTQVPVSPHDSIQVPAAILDDDSISSTTATQETTQPLQFPIKNLIDQEHAQTGGGDDADNVMYCIEVVSPETVQGGRVMCTNMQEDLQIGDHVYQWRSWMGIPGVFQHHGIVMDIQYQDVLVEEQDDGAIAAAAESQKDQKVVARLTIADFSNVEHQPVNRTIADPVEQQRRRRSGLTQEGILRTYTDTDKWHKVEYQASWWKRSVYRAGTCTSISSDAVGLVLARVNYILRHPDALPDYHVVNANCECVAVWCKTGRWSTLQASSFLELTAAGQVKSSASLAATAASTQVTVQTPAAGLWGWMGYTTASQVSWISLHPFFIPALAGYAAFSVGIPAIMYVNARKQWKLTTDRLKESFWEDAMKNPDVFAECITHWSEK